MPSLGLLKWFAIGGLVIGLLTLGLFYQGQGAKLATMETRAVVAEASAKAFKAAMERERELALETAEARAAERQQVIVIRDAAGTAKQGIANAPGASDAFHFSDAAHGFMRDEPEGDRPAGEAAPGMGGG
jgi:hypothetical protein